MYSESYSDEILKKFLKLKKREPVHLNIVKNKIRYIVENPNHRYKELRYGMKGLCRVHIGHYVLIFSINHEKKSISFEDYEHHDNAYI